MINSLRENLIRLTGKRDRHEIMSRLALDGILREHGVNVALHPGGWAASASLLLSVARIVTELPINKILELGCGQSTIMLAELARKLPREIELTTIEHDANWAEMISRRSGHEVDLAALTFDGRGYVLNKLPGPFDLIIVDGPPGDGSAHSRSGAVSVVEQHLSAEGVCVVDDTHRKGERATAEAIADLRPSAEPVISPYVIKEIRSTTWQTVVAHAKYGAMARSLA